MRNAAKGCTCYMKDTAVFGKTMGKHHECNLKSGEYFFWYIIQRYIL